MRVHRIRGISQARSTLWETLAFVIAAALKMTTIQLRLDRAIRGRGNLLGHLRMTWTANATEPCVYGFYADDTHNTELFSLGL